MSFFGPLLAKSAVGGFSPVCLLVLGSAALITYCYQNHRRNQRAAAYNNRIKRQQEAGDLNSSEVEDHLHLGVFGPYKEILRDERPFSRGEDGDKGHVEADHIPPLDSLRRAENEPEFLILREINPALYDMVMSLRSDPRGRNLFSVQVATQHHRAALSTGNSRESQAVRGVLAGRIARGEAKVMLKQAMIIAHPFVSQQIRNDAGITNRPPIEMILISSNRTRKIYKRNFLGLIYYNYQRGVINEEEMLELMQYVEDEDYTKKYSSEYKEIFGAVKESQK